MNELDLLMRGQPRVKKAKAKSKPSSRPDKRKQNELDILAAKEAEFAAMRREAKRWVPEAVVYVQHMVTCTTCGKVHLSPAVGENILLRRRHRLTGVLHEKAEHLRAEFLALPREVRTFSTTACACHECFPLFPREIS